MDGKYHQAKWHHGPMNETRKHLSKPKQSRLVLVCFIFEAVRLNESDYPLSALPYRGSCEITSCIMLPNGPMTHDEVSTLLKNPSLQMRTALRVRTPAVRCRVRPLPSKAHSDS